MSGAFLHGVGSVDPDRTGVTLWTRVSGVVADTEVRWTVASDPNLHRPVARGAVVAAAAADHTARVRVPDLTQGPLWYGFEVNGVRSDIGRTAILPTDTDQYRIGVVCCARYGSGWFHAYRMLAALQPDLVVHLGDYIYEDGGPCVKGREQDPPRRLRTLEDYRARYEMARRDADLQALHRVAPWVALWDDHEVADNAWRRGASGHDPQLDGDFQRRVEAARQAWWEWAPAPLSGGDDPSGGDVAAPLDRELAIGTLCDLLVVDTRSTGRQEPVDTSGGPSAQPLGDRRLLSVHQRTQLHARLGASGARWRILANQVQIAPLRLGYVPSRHRPFVRPLINPDQWDGYPQEREALLTLLQQQGIARTVALSGDLHASFVRRMGSRRAPVLPELTTPAVTAPSFGAHAKRTAKLPIPVTTAILKMLNRDIGFVDLRRNGFSFLTIQPDCIGIEVHLLGRADRPEPPPVEIRRFELKAGRSIITPVES